jgi:hypothetical protein
MMNQKHLYTQLTYCHKFVGIRKCELSKDYPKSGLLLDEDSSIGKLGFKEEPAGKLRIFAMVDP